MFMEGKVVTGFGRGSRQLGVPTANIDPSGLTQQLQGMSNGVYFGWAKLDAPEGWDAEDSKVHKMVMNVGKRPTVNTGKVNVASDKSSAAAIVVLTYVHVLTVLILLLEGSVKVVVCLRGWRGRRRQAARSDVLRQKAESMSEFEGAMGGDHYITSSLVL